MATPTTTHYSCASGGRIDMGRYVHPSWRPANGTIADVSLNTMYDVRGSYVKTAGQYDDFAGVAFAPPLGAYGHIFWNAGGHSDSQETPIFGYDAETRLHYLERNGAPASYPRWVDALGGTYNADTVTGWMFGPGADGLPLQVGEPFANHTYAYLTWIPEADLGGSAPRGWLYTPGRGSMPPTGSAGTGQHHKIPLGNGLTTAWQLHGSPASYRASHSFAIHDPSRKLIINGYGDYSYRRLFTMHLETGATGTIDWTASGDPFITAYYMTGKRFAAEDLLLGVRFNSASGLLLSVIDPVTVRHHQPGAAGTQPSGFTGEMVIEWVESWRSLVFFHWTSSTVWLLTAPDSPRTQPWVWSSQALTGTIRQPVAASNPRWNMIPYSQAAQCFYWPAAHNVPMQAFSLAAP